MRPKKEASQNKSLSKQNIPCFWNHPQRCADFHLSYAPAFSIQLAGLIYFLLLWKSYCGKLYITQDLLHTQRGVSYWINSFHQENLFHTWRWKLKLYCKCSHKSYLLSTANFIWFQKLHKILWTTMTGFVHLFEGWEWN